MYRALALILALAASAHASHLALLARPGVDGLPMGLGPKAKAHLKGQNARIVPDILPSIEALRLMTLGYKNLGADYYWLRCVNDYGDRRMARDRYPNLWPLLSRVQALDPFFVAPYIFAGNVMTLRDMPWRLALNMLETGMQQRPDSWRIAFSYGFNAYYLGERLDRAAHALARAAQSADAPPYLGPLALRMTAEAGEPEVGIGMVDVMLVQTNDDAQRQTLQQRRDRLMLEVHLKHLNRALDGYKAQHHRTPAALTELIGYGDVTRIAPDPLGGAFYIDAQGQVQTTHANARLRLNVDTAEVPRASH